MDTLTKDRLESGLVIRACGERIDEHDGLFCGSGCGFKCRRAAYDRACREAVKLARRLGDGWRGEVWENCGWHYQALKGSPAVAEVSVARAGNTIAGTWTVDGYYAEIMRPKQIFSEREPGANPHQFSARYFDDPREAFHSALANAHAFYEELRLALDEAAA
jgi:hypothetical protein